MKKYRIGIIAVLVIVCFALGYGIGKLFIGMKGDQEKGYIGPQEPVVENGVLSPGVLLSFGRLSDPQLSPDGTSILYGVSYTDIEENRSCRNIFVCDVNGGKPRQLTRYAKSVSCARWSKDGKSIYFLMDSQLWKAPLRGKKLGRREKLSDVPGGISDFKISPDESQILYVSSVQGPVTAPSDKYPELDKAQAYVATDLMYRHWDHWVTRTPRSFVAVLGNGTITADNSLDILAGEPGFELPTEPFGGAEQLDWAPDSRHIAYSCRKKTGKQYAFSTCSNIYIYDILTGHTIEVTSEGGYDTNPKWSPDGTALAWISMERDGYEADRQRLMVAPVAPQTQPADGQNFGLSVGSVRELSKDYIYDVEDLFWTPDCGQIIFPSTIDGLCALCSVPANGAGSIRRITPASWWLGFGVPFAYTQGEDGTSILCSYQSMEFPTELVAVNESAAGEVSYRQITSENTRILEQLSPIRQESITISGGNAEDFQCWVLYPPQFDPAKRYPAIEMFNGGPQTPLDQSWSYRWNFRMMCQQGYVVILPNRHGNSGFGQPWKEQISGDYQGLNMQDYLAAGRWIKSQPWCGKLAGVGASYGGFSAYNLMGIHGDLFDCFISHAGIFNEKQLWYTTEEAWFGNWDNGGLTPYAFEEGQTGPKGDGITFGGMQQAGAPYAVTPKAREHYAHDPESRITNWHTPILCIHGMMDFRIPYEQGMAAFNAAQMMGVPSKLIIFPEECHWILQPQNAMFWHREFFDWLNRWTKQ